MMKCAECLQNFTEDKNFGWNVLNGNYFCESCSDEYPELLCGYKDIKLPDYAQTTLERIVDENPQMNIRKIELRIKKIVTKTAKEQPHLTKI